MSNKTNFLILCGMFFLFGSSCKKNWLDAKPDQKLVVPVSLKDFQSLLDNTDVFNNFEAAIGEWASDDYYMSPSVYSSRPAWLRNIYIWTPGDVYDGQVINDWDKSYEKVFYANNILEGVAKIEKTTLNESLWNNVKGSALFYRAWAFYGLAQLFCKNYNSSTASSDLGIVIRTESDVNSPSIRVSVRQTYEQVISDLTQAKNLLTILPLYQTRPSKQAAFALLTRVYLGMSNYDSARVAADSCLQINGSIVDYNSVDDTQNNPFNYSGNISSEILYLSRPIANSQLPVITGSGFVDSTLFQMYAPEDLRKAAFFKGTYPAIKFGGSYYGSINLFFGLATDEIYLIRAECNARLGYIGAAMDDLNTLLLNRWKFGTFVPFMATDANDALRQILMERRKELCFRGLRWTDLRRINNDTQYARTLTRLIGSQTYTLPPNDIRYVWPIPDNEILYSGMQQNPR